MKEDMQQQPFQHPWHELSSQQTLSELDSQEHGLTPENAEQRLQQFGANHLPKTKGRSAIQRLAAQLHNLLIYILLGAPY